MRNLKLFSSGKRWLIGIFIVFLHVKFVLCGVPAKGSFEEQSTRLESTTKENNVQDANFKLYKGSIKKHVIPRDDFKTETKPDGNLVFYRTEKPKKIEKQRKPAILLKSAQVPANVSNNVVTVGDGLDLARASILRTKSSPTVVTSCVGNQVTLKCTAEGNPAPEFTWYKGSRAVNREKIAEFDLKIAPSLFTRASHLTLTPNGEEDFGEYQCAASNTLGATQQSTHRIILTDNGEPVCAQSAYNKDKKKFNSIIIGTVSSVGMLLILLCIAGFVFWRLNKQEADSYQRLKNMSASAETLEDGVEASTSDVNTESKEAEETIQDDFNAKEIGRLSSLLSGDWERLARLLGFHQHDINAIRDDSDKIESRCADMLNRFRRRCGSRETLAESVEEMKDIETASAIRQKYYKSNPTE